MQSKVDLYQDDGTTWESKEESKDGIFLSLSRRLPNLGDEIHLKGGRIVTPQNFATFENRVKMIYLWIFVHMKT